MDDQQSLANFNPLLANAIAAWLDSKIHRSNSQQTAIKYQETIQEFRTTLRTVGLDLDSAISLVALTAQSWAGQRVDGRRDVSANTYNQRLAILSSFYKYARKHGMISGENPMDLVERRPVQQYSNVTPLTTADIKARLARIDRSTPQGQRDYALLSVALFTGRRASELAGLRCGDIKQVGQKLVLTWRRTKGGKVMVDELGAGMSKSLLAYVNVVYGVNPDALSPDMPVWVAFTNNRSRGGAISPQAIADICFKYLGTGKVHTTRHTFAHMMEESGAKVSEIGSRLGHESLQTTTRYLASLARATNPYSSKLEDALGINDDQ